MRPRIDWRASARSDLLTIITHVAQEHPPGALALLDAIEVAVMQLPEHPHKCPMSRRAPGYRQLTVRTNYLVFYRLLPEGAEPPLSIDIVAVVHARRMWP